jgi:spermidine synthase
MAALNDLKPGPRKVGVVGLGAGVLAAYGRKGDAITFYEISPRIIEAQRTEFTFLRDTPARTEIVLGDGRLSLEREPARGFDLLAIDAFSGDSIPMHLVSREAMAVYVRHLAPGGVMMFQATNRYIDLAPVVQRLAAEQGMHAYIVSDDVEEQGGEGFWLSSTDQILVTRDEAFLKHPRIAGAAVPIPPRDDLPTFTDAHHNLLRILKW